MNEQINNSELSLTHQLSNYLSIFVISQVIKLSSNQLTNQTTSH